MRNRHDLEQCSSFFDLAKNSICAVFFLYIYTVRVAIHIVALCVCVSARGCVRVNLRLLRNCTQRTSGIETITTQPVRHFSLSLSLFQGRNKEVFCVKDRCGGSGANCAGKLAASCVFCLLFATESRCRWARGRWFNSLTRWPHSDTEGRKAKKKKKEKEKAVSDDQENAMLFSAVTVHYNAVHCMCLC